MSVKVKDIMGVMEEIAPRHLAEGWDNVGLAIGDPEKEVTKILVALDVIDPVVEEAKAIGAEMIVTHHPMLLFKKIESITTQNTLGKRIYNLIENGIAAFSAHTNLDIAKGGTNDVLAELAGLENLELLEERTPTYHCDCGVQRFERGIISLGSKEIQDMIDEDGQAEVVCRFCNKKYVFDKYHLQRLLDEAK